MLRSLLALLGLVGLAAAGHFTIVIDAGSTGCRLYVYHSDTTKVTKHR